jgi:hypothetical protein
VWLLAILSHTPWFGAAETTGTNRLECGGAPVRHHAEGWRDLQPDGTAAAGRAVAGATLEVVRRLGQQQGECWAQGRDAAGR